MPAFVSSASPSSIALGAAGSDDEMNNEEKNDRPRRRQRTKTDQGDGAKDSHSYTGKKLALQGEKVAPFLKLLTKQLLRISQDMRDVQGCLLDVSIGEQEQQIAKAMKAKTVAYSKLENKKGEPPPHLWAFQGLLDGLAAMGEAIGAANAAKVKQFLEQYSNQSNEEAGEMIRICYLKPTYEKGKCRIILEISRCPIRENILSALVQAGFSRKMGKPPPGHMERELSDWLERFL